MMTSAVMSSQSAVSYSTTSRWYLKLAIAKRCRLDKRIRHAFCLRAKVQSMDFVMVITSSVLTNQSLGNPDASYSDPVASTSRPTTGVPAASISSPASHPVASTSRPPADVPVASTSRPPADVQVASYSDPDARYNESAVRRRTIQQKNDSAIESEQGLFKGEDLKEEDDDCVKIQKQREEHRRTKQSTTIREELTTSVDC
ncbi:putative beta-D-xylosidase 7-like [Dorcoceras hygrometricum]|uniref:Putative beta-D-xylosidase 7-like n=1 Tax=Dorcoceras hygrometricum TaxID=472368 RepID=A0A2Z7A4Z5_9LAMI|nr:putative beta-D-xylosidase 7-like [Dorcoceras hygrometricum]